jgi:hypothetical protein
VVVVRLPFISHADRWLRKVLHRAIGYPSQAHRLAALLSSAPLSPSKEVRSEVSSVLMRRGYDLEDDWLPVAQPMRELWHRAAMLFQQVRGWEHDKRYGDFVSAAREEFDVLRHRFDQLSMKVVRVLGTIERLGGLWEQVECATLPAPAGRRSTDCDEARSQCGDTVRAVVNELLADLREDIAFFQRNLCVLVARGVLAQSTTVRQRQRRLEELGFTMELRGASTATLLAWAAGLYFVVFVGFLALPPLLHDANFAHLIEQLVRVTRITGSQVLAVAVAIIPKQHFGFANEDLHGRTPWGFVLGAGLVAAALAAAIQIAFPGSTFSKSAPWLGMPFATAAIIAYLVQDSRWKGSRFANRQRMADAVVMLIGVGVALALAGLKWVFFGNLSPMAVTGGGTTRCGPADRGRHRRVRAFGLSAADASVAAPASTSRRRCSGYEPVSRRHSVGSRDRHRLFGDRLSPTSHLPPGSMTDIHHALLLSVKLQGSEIRAMYAQDRERSCACGSLRRKAAGSTSAPASTTRRHLRFPDSKTRWPAWWPSSGGGRHHQDHSADHNGESKKRCCSPTAISPYQPPSKGDGAVPRLKNNRPARLNAVPPLTTKARRKPVVRV